MEFTSSIKKQRVLAIFDQIRASIGQLKDWNSDVTQVDDYYVSSSGLDPLFEAVEYFLDTLRS